MSNMSTACHYPTIFFYNLDQMKVQWEIFGGEILIDVTEENEVIYTTNEAWTKLNQEEIMLLLNSKQSLYNEF